MTEYKIIFHGASYKNRMIEAYLPEYKHSQFVLHSPIINCNHIFGFISDEFWRSHEELNIEIKKILTQIAYKHLWFILAWDLCPQDKWHTFECWKFWVDEYIERCSAFNPNEEEYQMCLNSFYNKYTREKGKRIYTYIEDENI